MPRRARAEPGPCYRSRRPPLTAAAQPSRCPPIPCPPCAVIRFFLLQNRAGKTRLAKYYMPLSDDDKKRTEDEVYRLIVNRDAKFTNFLEVKLPLLAAGWPCKASSRCLLLTVRVRHGLQPVLPSACPQYKTYKLVYRRYAGLYFLFCVDVTDNELLYLETIHLFVEVGRRCCQGARLPVCDEHKQCWFGHG